MSVKSYGYYVFLSPPEGGARIPFGIRYYPVELELGYSLTLDSGLLCTVTDIEEDGIVTVKVLKVPVPSVL